MTEYSALWSDSTDSESTAESISSIRELRDSTKRYPNIFDNPGSNDFSAPADHHVDHPVLADHSLWSDSSDSESTVDSITSFRLRDATKRYPIVFDSSGSNDLSASVDHPVDHPVPTKHSPGPIRSSSQQTLVFENNSPTGSLSPVKSVAARVHFTLETSRSDAQYSSPSLWSQNLTGTNHYFREKKWDFFPELATPSARQGSLRTSPNLCNGELREKAGRLNLAAKRRGSHSPDRAGLGLAQRVRDSIKTYVHRTLLSRPTTEPKVKD